MHTLAFIPSECIFCVVNGQIAHPLAKQAKSRVF